MKLEESLKRFGHLPRNEVLLQILTKVNFYSMKELTLHFFRNDLFLIEESFLLSLLFLNLLQLLNELKFFSIDLFRNFDFHGDIMVPS